MEQTINQRVKQVLKFMGLTENSVAKKLEISQTTLNSALNSKKDNLNSKIIAGLKRNYPDINIDWLLTGEGEMLNARNPFESNATFAGKAVAASGDDLVSVRYFDISPTATFKEFCNGASDYPDSITILPDPFETLDDSYCVFRVSGESMAPQIQDHSLILCREVSPTRWHSLSDCIVAIAYADRFVLKRIERNRLDSANYLTLASDNPDHPGTETVELSSIRCIFKAVRVISQRIY